MCKCIRPMLQWWSWELKRQKVWFLLFVRVWWWHEEECLGILDSSRALMSRNTMSSGLYSATGFSFSCVCTWTILSLLSRSPVCLSFPSAVCLVWSVCAQGTRTHACTTTVCLVGSVGEGETTGGGGTYKWGKNGYKAWRRWEGGGVRIRPGNWGKRRGWLGDYVTQRVVLVISSINHQIHLT